MKGYVHSCIYRGKIIVNFNYNFAIQIAGRTRNIRLHATIADILEAVAHGCMFALKLGLNIFANGTIRDRRLILCACFPEHAVEHFYPDRIGPFSLWNPETKKVEATFGPDFVVYTPKGLFIERLRCHRRRDINSYIEANTHQCAGNKADRQIFTRPINTHPFSLESVQQIRLWLGECSDSHLECSKVGSETMLTRLILISKDDDQWSLLLIQSDIDEFIPYAALSYCWGQQSFF
jgi:hypothetical protein